MDSGAADASGGGHIPAAALASAEQPIASSPPPPPPPSHPSEPAPPPHHQQQQQQPLSRYESQKRRDWNTFLQYLRNHKPPLTLARCSGAHVIEFLKYLDQFGKTKVHAAECPYYGHPNPPTPCACSLRQAWGSLDALIGRLRAAYEENGGRPESNPFAARAVRIYLREVRESQAKARGIPYEKKKRKRSNQPPPDAVATGSPPSTSSAATGAEDGAEPSSARAVAVPATIVTTTTITTTRVSSTDTAGSTAGPSDPASPQLPEGSSTP